MSRDDYRPLGAKPEVKSAKEMGRLGPPDGLINLAEMLHAGIPVRHWLVPDLIPMANVTQLSGDGGLGKSLLTLQLAVCCALQQQWCGFQVSPCRSLLVYCEDDPDEIMRRLYEVTMAYGATIEDVVEHIDIVSRVGADNSLMTFSRWGEELPKSTPFYDKIRYTVENDTYGLIVMDSSHDLFIGNENDRTQVRQFVGSLRALSKINEAAVVLNSHPSVTGMNSGTGSSGSTAWNNAVRSRLYLTRPEGQDKRKRILKTMKANYAMGDSEIPLEWHNGIMVPDALAGTTERAVKRMETGAAIGTLVEICAKLCARGIYPSVHDNHPKEYIVKLMLQQAEFHGYEKGGMTALVQKAVKDRLLESIVIPGSRRGKYRNVLVPWGFRPPKNVEIDYAAPAAPAAPGGGQTGPETNAPAMEEPPPAQSPDDYGARADETDE